MTTDKPAVIAWAPSLDLAKLSLNGGGRNGVGCILTDGPTPHGNDAAMIRLSDYKALQAECERWKNSASGAHQQLTANRIETDKLAVDWSNAMAECEKLRKDAERYRWLRDQEARDNAICVLDCGEWVKPAMVIALAYSSAEQCDAAIDAALKEQTQ